MSFRRKARVRASFEWTNVLKAKWPRAITSAFKAGRYVYDLEVTEPGGGVKRLMEGAFVIRKTGGYPMSCSCGCGDSTKTTLPPVIVHVPGLQGPRVPQARAAAVPMPSDTTSLRIFLSFNRRRREQRLARAALSNF